ncbi:MAG: two-component regulator propeller domain-containing protein [Candidatus Cloacimonetes bacterium]|nr:two-component regulator propeller domain-containing protein [Candidatus Cloacimonadota bacterium]
MKASLLLFFVISTLSFMSAHAENWTNLNNQNNLKCTAWESETLWCGTSGGLVKLNTATGNKTYYNTTNAGLPSTEVYSLYIDHQGKKWIGTDNGLCRLDNGDWTVWNTTNSGIPNNFISDIAADAYNNIYVATNNGLGRLSNNSWTSWNTSNSSLHWNDITCLDIDNNGNVWIGTGMGLSLFSAGTFTQLSAESIWCMDTDSQGNRWFGTGYNGLAKYSGNSWTYYNPSNSGIPDVGVGCIKLDTQDNVWLSAQGRGLVKFDGTIWTIWNTQNSDLPIDYISSITIDNDSNIWAGTELRGITKFNGISMVTYNVSNTGIADPDVNCITIDNLGRKWIGSECGMGLLANDSWHTYDFVNTPGIIIDVAKIAVDANHTAWIDSDYGLVSFDGSEFILHNPLDFGLQDGSISLLETDNLGNLWIGGLQRFVKHQNGINTVYDTTNSPLSSYPRKMKQDAYNNLWIATSENGLLHYNGVLWSFFNQTNSNIPNNNIRDLELDGYGNKWMGTHSGLCKFDGATWTIWNTQNSAIPANYVWHLEIDSSNNVWIITSSSQEGYMANLKLSRFDGTSWTHWSNTNSPLPIRPVSDMLIDSNDNVWITAERSGVMIFNPNGIVANSEELAPAASELILIRNYPNPFRESTQISYQLKKNGFVKAGIYNLRGQLVRNLVSIPQKAGEHTIAWNGTDNQGKIQPVGIYFIHIQSGRISSAQKMIHFK